MRLPFFTRHTCGRGRGRDDEIEHCEVPCLRSLATVALHAPLWDPATSGTPLLCCRRRPRSSLRIEKPCGEIPARSRRDPGTVATVSEKRRADESRGDMAEMREATRPNMRERTGRIECTAKVISRDESRPNKRNAGAVGGANRMHRQGDQTRATAAWAWLAAGLRNGWLSCGSSLR